MNIHAISGQIPHSHTKINLELNGCNLILVGKNGSGKTQLLTSLYYSLLKQINQNISYTEALKNLEKARATSPDHSSAGPHNAAVRHFENHLIQYENQAVPIIENYTPYRDLVIQGRAALLFFEATRTTTIAVPQFIVGIKKSRDAGAQAIQNSLAGGVPGNHTCVGNQLEQYLINLENRRAISVAADDDSEGRKISSFFKKFSDNLKMLMEDDSVELKFDLEDTKIILTRENKSDTSFQHLSSGYSAIFNFYSEILLRTEFLGIAPQDYEGIIFIDELEVHLHVSLQRLILPFLTKSFPKIQFIVTTHSPFILTSVNNALIYDLSSNSIVKDDISLYSFKAVMEGLFETKTTSILLD